MRRGLDREANLGLPKCLFLLVETESARDRPRKELVIELQTQVKVLGGSVCEGTLAHTTVCSSSLCPTEKLTVFLNNEEIALTASHSERVSSDSMLSP